MRLEFVNFVFPIYFAFWELCGDVDMIYALLFSRGIDDGRRWAGEDEQRRAKSDRQKSCSAPMGHNVHEERRVSPVLI